MLVCPCVTNHIRPDYHSDARGIEVVPGGAIEIIRKGVDASNLEIAHLPWAARRGVWARKPDAQPYIHILMEFGAQGAVELAERAAI